MLDQWYRHLRLKMPVEQFHALPRNPAFTYEYIDGEARLTPRPKTFNAVLELKRGDAAERHRAQNESLTIRPVIDDDWQQFPSLFAAAFDRIQPFASLTAEERLAASREAIEQTRTGGDGLLLDEACFAAVTEDSGQIAAAVLVTLIPREAEGDWWDGKWEVMPTTEEARHLLGRPHLTWIFVAPLYANHGLGSALLVHASNALLNSGYFDLGTTFLLGNHSSMLWHWRNGFRLLPYPGSPRVWRPDLVQSPGS
jgi:GNAT superfamily N-acetyltransferase